MKMMMYGFMYKIKKLIMGLLDKKNKQLKEKEIKNNKQNELNLLRTQLTSNEVQYLIGLIARSDFKGSDLQIIFQITAKLQNQLKW